jgi:alcohol dehydrogenase class IV
VLDLLRPDPAVADRIAALGAALEGVPLGEASAERTVARVVAINAAIGVPADLAAIGIDRDQLPHVADLGLRSARLLAIAPVDPTRELLLDLLEHAHAGLLTDRSVA